MTRQLEQRTEDARRKQRDRVGLALGGGLDAALQSAGYELLGFSAKLNQGDCLLTLRLDTAQGRMVCFVGSETIITALLKAQREARAGELRVRADRYAG